MNEPSKPLEGWHCAKGALSFAHRWHTKDLSDGHEWVEADCAVGIAVHAANIEKAQPGHAVCPQCRDATIRAIEDDLLAITRGLAMAKALGLSLRVPAPAWMFDLAEAMVKILPPESPNEANFRDDVPGDIKEGA